MAEDKKPITDEKTTTKTAVKPKPKTEKKTPTKKTTTAKKETTVKTKTEKKTPAKKTTTKKPTEKKPKPAAKPKTEEKPEPEKDKQEKEVKEEKKYIVKKKPEIPKELKQRLKVRKELKKRTPDFLREEWFRYKKISKNWRRPDGITSKMRRNLKYRPSRVRVGFRGPRETRGLHSSGFEEVIIYNINDLKSVNPKTQAARVGSSVGTKKRMDIEKKAEELDVRILNM